VKSAITLLSKLIKAAIMCNVMLKDSKHDNDWFKHPLSSTQTVWDYDTVTIRTFELCTLFSVSTTDEYEDSP